VLLFVILVTISQSTYFAISYTGSMDRVLSSIKLSEKTAKYCHKSAVFYAMIAWVFCILNLAFLLYTAFFAGSILDFNLAPFTTHLDLPPDRMMVVRVMSYLINIYLIPAWVFPHAMSFMLATVFTHQYKELSRSFEERLAESRNGNVRDSDIELFRQRHQEISLCVNSADGILMFHTAAAFCIQLFLTVIILYSLIFFLSATGFIIVLMRVCWLVGNMSGLVLTSAGGIIINHYVRTTNV